MIEKIQVTDPTVIDSIREAIPTATRQAKGANAYHYGENLINSIYH